MVLEMDAGLASEEGNTLKMIISSSVTSLPTGNEEGLFYGVNLSGTNLHIVRVQLGGNDARVIKQELTEVPIPATLMVGSSEELFNYIAAELAKYASIENESFHVLAGRPKELGFTFSCPVEENVSRTVIKWTMGFSIKDTVGKDLVTEINEAMEKNGADMHVSSLVNDTVGTLAGARYFNSDVVAAVILGMGTNAAYIEHTNAIHKLHGPLSETGEMVINMEWGGFHSSYLPITEFDVCLDVESSNPGEKIFEKLISGMYLGEIVRRVLLRIAEETAIFGESIPSKLRIPFVLRTPDLAAMHQDTTEDLEVVGEKMKDTLGILESTVCMRKIVVEVCNVVAERGARLAGAGIVAILKKLGRAGTRQRSVVAVDGGLYEHYRLFRNYLHMSVNEMLGGEFPDNVVIEHSNEGSGIGAALLAASRSKYV
ncbi:hexokinase-1-like isoform X2 [Tasmannia lanceolata]